MDNDEPVLWCIFYFTVLFTILSYCTTMAYLILRQSYSLLKCWPWVVLTQPFIQKFIKSTSSPLNLGRVEFAFVSIFLNVRTLLRRLWASPEKNSVRCADSVTEKGPQWNRRPMIVESSCCNGTLTRYVFLETNSESIFILVTNRPLNRLLQGISLVCTYWSGDKMQ